MEHLSPAVKSHLSHLPQQLMPFIGREEELAELARLLADPNCRLLTLAGLGGIGKTRLAIQAATQTADHFPQGVYFVPLQSIQAGDFLISAIVNALDVSLAGPAVPFDRLLSHLHDKELLLLLDNFEQLLPVGEADLLARLLRAAPLLKLLVTSREVLNLQEEWIYPVEGLPVPPTEEIAAGEIESYSAAQLFIERARQVRRDFSLADELAGVVRICQLVEGMPLALEMAASWLKTLTCAEVATEIQHNLDFLATHWRDIPNRHRNMRAVFDHSWQHLSPEQQSIFMRLSVFRGGFQRVAAESVAGATLPTLTALADKSLLRWEPDTRRYYIHELLRQFGEEQLCHRPEEQAHTRHLHCAYYANFLTSRFSDLNGARQHEAVAEIEAELENTRAAWQWATAQARLAEIEQAVRPLLTFCQIRSRYLEGAKAFAPTYELLTNLPSTPERDRTLAVFLTCQGWLDMRLGRLEQATQAIETASHLFAVHNISPLPVMGTDPLSALSILAVIRGDYTAAVALGEQARQAAGARHDRANLAFAGYALTSAAIAQGQYEQALHHARETLALTQDVGNRWFMAYVYNHLGQITQMLGDLAAAREYYRASYAIRDEFDDPEGMAVALLHLGEIALLEKEFGQGHQHYQQSLAIYHKIGDRGGLVRALQGLGLAAHRLNDEPAARQYLRQSLQTAAETQIVPLLLSVLARIGTYLVESAAPEQGVALLLLIEQHPAADQLTKSQAQLLASQRAGPSPIRLSEVGHDGPEPDLDALVATLLAELDTPVPLSGNTPAPADRAPAQPLLDPLSERELEVLRGIAAGLHNREIAQELIVTLSTVKAHINHIYQKLGVSNRVQALARARELNLL
jgi:predicted ATPase/DNA-binding NarL/FixJ family response regulator